MYNLSKQQQSTAIIRDKLGFQVFEQLAETQSTSCSPNLPSALSHPQKGFTLSLKIYSLIARNECQFIIQPLYF